ncbi:MAG: triose-phosphate isomerase, partial [Alphaproteobacteria bacterium]
MKIIVANWKMNNGFDEVDQWIEAFYEVFFKKIEDDNLVEVVLCPPNIMLDY